MEKIQFAGGKFYATVTARVQEYFDATHKSIKGNRNLYTKTIVLLVSWVALYLSMMIWARSFVTVTVCYVSLGILITLLGFNVMHDG